MQSFEAVKKAGIFFLLLIFLIPSIFSLLQPGFFQSDDGDWMVIRFSAFYQALTDGQFPVRFLGRLNHGFGYPVANFLYPGFMYLAAPIKLLGLGFVSSIKIVLILSMLGGGFFAFKWLAKIFDEKAAFIGAVFYTYTPYHLYDLYKRGSVGEILSIAILPFVLWQIERNNFFLVSLGIFLIILAHNSLAVLFLLFLIFYMGLNIYISSIKQELAKNYLISLLLGFGMASFFWIPALAELRFTSFSETKVSQWANYFADANLIGGSTLVVFGIVMLLTLTGKIKPKEHRLTLFLFVVGLLSVFLSSSISAPLWNILPSSFIQFPFRFLSLLIPSVAFMAACIVSILGNKSKNLMAALLLIILFISSLSFLKPEVKFDKDDSFYSTNEGTTNVKDEYMPYWVKEKPDRRFEDKVEVIGKGEVKNLIYNSKRINFRTLFESEQTARVNTIYYPGWKASVNGQQIEIDYGNSGGVMDLKLPAGTNTVELKFEETPLRLFADFLSLASLTLLFVWRRKDFLSSQILKKIRMLNLR